MSSITHVVDSETEEILNRYEYDAWGNLTVCEEEVSNRFKFNGQQYDSVTQQYYLRARYYNPVIGRFTQEDTYRGDGLNLYAYCANNPICYVDPSGHTLCEDEEERKRIVTAVLKNTATEEEKSELKEYLEDKINNFRALKAIEQDALKLIDLTYYNEQFPKNIFPTRTDKAHKVARKIAKIMKQLNISGALTVFIHEDKSVSVGISGDNTITHLRVMWKS